MATYNEIQQAKIRRNVMYEQIIDTKQKLSDARMQLYLIRNQVKPELTEARQQNTITWDSYKRIDKVENFKIDDGLLKPDTVAFSDMDDELMTMMETVEMSLERFESRLKLYNHESQTISNENLFFNLDKPFKVKLRVICCHSGARKMMEKLQRAKQNGGTRILQIESEIAEKSKMKYISDKFEDLAVHFSQKKRRQA
ncbi:uncharacterized protein RHIMIDRAFT_315410 [Rhizopus microsporus ATCC 52813]|uniref:Uncharacterized protein n=2 Tax=Rhizopus microsporus TaxID=58291 RepID=A0A2G4SL31_RHIZD|nr:uncharacterized protein RHIMIDRAFT_315410 [Rhizopus microsporus ATCC 52813]PHZ09480.1 hypothetical protein RHIMIDRAFT_315410 [Rhizopus microsporus ATCC 52813]